MIIIGKGGMGREVQAYLAEKRKFRELMLTSDEFLNATPNVRSFPAVIAIGDGAVRKRIEKENSDIEIWGNVDLGTSYAQVDIGDGCIICPGAIITTNVWIGRHIIVNVNASISHDCNIGDYSTISPGAVLCGNVTLGENVFIGANAVVREKIKICDNVIIGAGAVVVKDIDKPGTYVGNPAKRLVTKSKTPDINIFDLSDVAKQRRKQSNG